MSKSKKSLEERISELEQKRLESLGQSKKYDARIKELEKRDKAEKVKARTHRLCVIGGAVESVLGRAIEPDEVHKLTAFLEKQEQNGSYFSRAMEKRDEVEVYGSAEVETGETLL